MHAKRIWLGWSLLLTACCATNPPKDLTRQVAPALPSMAAAAATPISAEIHTLSLKTPQTGFAVEPSECTPPFTHAADTAAFDDECGAEGEPEPNDKQARAAEYTAKNNLCANASAPVTLSFADFKKLQHDIPDDVLTGDSNTSVQDRSELRSLALSHARKVGEGQLVRLVGLAMVKTSKSNEGVNCHNTAEAKTDVHINISPNGQECDGIVVEIIPHHRPVHWTHTEAKNKVDQSIVRVTGQLFLDSRHSVEPRTAPDSCPSPKRVSLWEIHPVYAMDICRNGTLANCKADDDSVWSPFAQ